MLHHLLHFRHVLLPAPNNVALLSSSTPANNNASTTSSSSSSSSSPASFSSGGAVTLLYSPPLSVTSVALRSESDRLQCRTVAIKQQAEGLAVHEQQLEEYIKQKWHHFREHQHKLDVAHRKILQEEQRLNSEEEKAIMDYRNETGRLQQMKQQNNDKSTDDSSSARPWSQHDDDSSDAHTERKSNTVKSARILPSIEKKREKDKKEKNNKEKSDKSDKSDKKKKKSTKKKTVDVSSSSDVPPSPSNTHTITLSLNIQSPQGHFNTNNAVPPSQSHSANIHNDQQHSHNSHPHTTTTTTTHQPTSDAEPVTSPSLRSPLLRRTSLPLDAIALNSSLPTTSALDDAAPSLLNDAMPPTHVLSSSARYWTHANNDIIVCVTDERVLFINARTTSIESSEKLPMPLASAFAASSSNSSSSSHSSSLPHISMTASSDGRRALISHGATIFSLVRGGKWETGQLGRRGGGAANEQQQQLNIKSIELSADGMLLLAVRARGNVAVYNAKGYRHLVSLDGVVAAPTLPSTSSSSSSSSSTPPPSVSARFAGATIITACNSLIVRSWQGIPHAAHSRLIGRLNTPFTQYTSNEPPVIVASPVIAAVAWGLTIFVFSLSSLSCLMNVTLTCEFSPLELKRERELSKGWTNPFAAYISQLFPAAIPAAHMTVPALALPSIDKRSSLQRPEVAKKSSMLSLPNEGDSNSKRASTNRPDFAKKSALLPNLMRKSSNLGDSSNKRSSLRPTSPNDKPSTLRLPSTQHHSARNVSTPDTDKQAPHHLLRLPSTQSTNKRSSLRPVTPNNDKDKPNMLRLPTVKGTPNRNSLRVETPNKNDHSALSVENSSFVQSLASMKRSSYRSSARNSYRSNRSSLPPVNLPDNSSALLISTHVVSLSLSASSTQLAYVTDTGGVGVLEVAGAVREREDKENSDAILIPLRRADITHHLQSIEKREERKRSEMKRLQDETDAAQQVRDAARAEARRRKEELIQQRKQAEEQRRLKLYVGSIPDFSLLHSPLSVPNPQPLEPFFHEKHKEELIQKVEEKGDFFMRLEGDIEERRRRMKEREDARKLEEAALLRAALELHATTSIQETKQKQQSFLQRLNRDMGKREKFRKQADTGQYYRKGSSQPVKMSLPSIN